MKPGDRVVANSFGCTNMEGTVVSEDDEQVVVTLVGWAGPLDWDFRKSEVRLLEEAEAAGLEIQRPWQGEAMADNTLVKSMLKNAIKL